MAQGLGKEPEWVRYPKRHGSWFIVTGQPRHRGDHISQCWLGLIGICAQEGVLQQVWDGAIGCGRRTCFAGDLF
ncbi:hypothetical protein [Parasynechococcus sp.]|uniref:hypothetical protein n=1 Tax=Parasynechococcus sp. TaxID=3101203 RepID=UPI003703C340